MQPPSKKFKGSLDNEEEDTGDQVQEASAEKETIARLSEPQRLIDLSDVNKETLEKLNIVLKGSLKLKSAIEERIEKSKSSGKDEFWSSTQMYLHLALLERLLSRENQPTQWIDTFLFRASAMVVPGKCMIINMNEGVPATIVNPSSLITISGYRDYTVVISSDRFKSLYRSNPQVVFPESLKTSFFVTEAKTRLSALFEYLPRALCQLYVSAKQLKKETIRGVVTNGYKWQFIILSIHKNGDGASYKFSIPIKYYVPQDPNPNPIPKQPWPDVIAGVLSDWVQSSFDDLDEDDWFENVGGR
ncbi:hypothetical protein BDP27DRAFT_1444611 [Rhodocollybia butyracea]|uniref:Uncharacterized protein n=1 Tax=Rhodocollybia butyracea TaxID=206335 RepID=A0A9P5Q4P4_9AGAR|nr:hypothetical protein BDP27DRAFT_1444611 [Rhodocollybia butyracea]